jgi:D-glycero-D-manno-heptose 1,7-bisphosphate phosphatase
LNVEKGYVHKWKDWEWLPGVPEGLRQLSFGGYALIVISNQAGIARGYYSENDVLSLHAAVQNDLRRHGVEIDAFVFCPHHPEFSGLCRCRKPAPGMLARAASELSINLRASWMIGDKVSDLEAGRAVGVRVALVDTGYGRIEVDVQEKPMRFAELVGKILSVQGGSQR